MSNNRRSRLPGGTYFFSVQLEPLSGVSLIEHLPLLRQAYAQAFDDVPFITDAIVILPDHLHAVWSLPPGDADYSSRWSKIKRRFTRALGRVGPRSPSKVAKREAGIWQRRFWEHTIWTRADYQRHVEYCWSDPVRHGLVTRPADWAASSIHREIGAGLISSTWKAVQIDGDFGESATHQSDRPSSRVAWARAHPTCKIRAVRSDHNLDEIGTV